MNAARKIVARLSGMSKIRGVLVVGVIATTVIAGGAVPAHASAWMLTDDFEINPASTWVPYASQEGGGHFSDNAGWARSPSKYAYRWVETGFSSVHRNVHLTPAQFHVATCAAAVYIRAVTVPAIVNLEVINPVNWTSIAFTRTALNPSSGYVRLLTPGWTAHQVDVVVRAAVEGYGTVSDIRVDDLGVQCIY